MTPLVRQRFLPGAKRNLSSFEIALKPYYLPSRYPGYMEVYFTSKGKALEKLAEEKLQTNKLVLLEPTTLPFEQFEALAGCVLPTWLGLVKACEVFFVSGSKKMAKKMEEIVKTRDFFPYHSVNQSLDQTR